MSSSGPLSMLTACPSEMLSEDLWMGKLFDVFMFFIWQYLFSLCVSPYTWIIVKSGITFLDWQYYFWLWICYSIIRVLQRNVLLIQLFLPRLPVFSRFQIILSIPEALQCHRLPEYALTLFILSVAWCTFWCVNPNLFPIVEK